MFKLLVLALLAVAVQSQTAGTGRPSTECPNVDGEFPRFLPHPTDCTLYQKCNSGYICKKIDKIFN